jgi:cobalt/nickel transport system ATP-binding protein
LRDCADFLRLFEIFIEKAAFFMLELSGLTVVYPDRTKAVDSVSFRIEKGETVGLTGANGAGKTTLLLALAGVLPAEGAVFLDGTPLQNLSDKAFRPRAGLVFQNPDDQLFMPTVYEDIAFGPRNFGVSAAETEKRIGETLALLNAGHLRDKSTLKLSGGEKRIAAIAAVLVLRPAVLLFDEPTAFLDLKARRALIGLIRALPQTKIIASHDLPFLAETCGRTVLMKNGKIFATDDTADLLRDDKKMRACDLETLSVYGGGI